MDLESLISQTEALSWEDPSTQIETIQINSTNDECLPLIGHLISQKTHNNQSVNATLNKAWEFAVPFSFAALGPNKFLFKFNKQEHIDRIHKQPTWNVNGSLLSLQQWSPKATMGELSTNMSPFWIQIHGLPLANLSLKNAIAIGKGMGQLIKVEDISGANKTFRSYLRILVEINVYEPLKPGFSFRRDEGQPIWISFKYERLDIYCTSCGRIGHKNQSCHAPPEETFPEKYSISLKVNIFSNLLPTSSGAWGYSEGVSPQSQPSSTQKTIQTTGEDPKTHKYLNSTHLTTSFLNPLKNLSLQPQKPTTLPQVPQSTSHQPLSSLNATLAKPPTTTRIDSVALKDPTLLHHSTPQLTSTKNCPVIVTPTSPFPGSISIELNNFNPGPVSVTNTKAHINLGKKPITSPTHSSINFSHPTVLTNSSNTIPSPAKKPPSKHSPFSRPSHYPPRHQKSTRPLLPDNEPPTSHSPTHKTHLKKKRNRLTGNLNPLKKGPGSSHFDHLVSDDMETSYQIDTNTTLPNPSSPHRLRHFFKASRKGKQVSTPAHNTFFESGDNVLSPKTS